MIYGPVPFCVDFIAPGKLNQPLSIQFDLVLIKAYLLLCRVVISF